MTWHTNTLVAADKSFLWHPFTPMRQWCAPDHEPTVICRGEGVWLYDTRGRRYFDGNSSIWTNIHGHSHPRLLRALQTQSEQLCHSSFLGATNPPAIQLAEELVRRTLGSDLRRVFYSDDGSTAIEVALKMTCQYFQQTGMPQRKVFVSFDQAYHGDTMGASSLGGVPLFFDRFKDYHFPTRIVKSLGQLEDMSSEETEAIAAVVIEPIIQGVAGMRPWPNGMLQALRQWCDRHGVLLIFDEVMTAFGRTGTLFACENEGVWPDFLALAKGLTGGLMPLAATLTTERIYEAFLGELSEGKTFYYGHSYTGNPLGCAVALENLRMIDDMNVLTNARECADALWKILHNELGKHGHVLSIRGFGLIAGIEVSRRIDPVEPYPSELRVGARICERAKALGVMTRPILDTVVFMPPPAVSRDDMSWALQRLCQALDEVTGSLENG